MFDDVWVALTDTLGMCCCAGGHMPYGAPPGGPSMRPHMHAGPPAAAAAGGYGAPRGAPGPDRNVRPRHSGGGGMPVGAAGPVAGQAGFKPGVCAWCWVGVCLCGLFVKLAVWQQ